jgi:hypothetical protein
LFVPVGVFVVRHDAFDEGDARGEVDAADDSVFVAANIEAA